ncbi:MAG TPA: transglutaminaseTgpA domain-containing protein [Streptosporangiaceae bacterium]|nr:transglutaminaseTgpA domain-containing protein [Streptosporangiaceae bacterium]
MNHRFTVTAALASAAASASLVPLMSGGKWFWGGIGAILMVALVGTATRARALRALPAAVCLLCALAALVLYLNVVFSAKSSFLGFIPTGASLTALWRSALQGLSDTQKYAPPVPPIAALQLLATAGIGLAASVTDLIAVRLRRCALAGLPLLVLFSVPIATNAGKSALEDLIVFCLGMAGYLALLSADGRERLRLWGRLVTPWNNGQDEQTEELEGGQSLRDLAASGRRIGLAAVALALFVPLLLPSLHVHRLFQGQGTNGGLGPGGGSGAGLPDPIALMNGQLREPKPQPVLTYTTDAPSNNPQYLQVYVLNKLTTAGWSLTRTGQVFSLNAGQMPPPPGLTSKVKWPVVHTTVNFSGGFSSRQSYLPMPYPATKVDVPGTWQANTGTLMLYSLSMPLSALQYTVTSDYIDPQSDVLDAAPATTGMGGYLTVPSAYRSLTSLARQVTKGATTPGAQGAALENWFSDTGGFTYSLSAPQAKGAAALRDFLFHVKRGYCQQFAYAMGVLARLLGIPSRVVVGYTSGTYEGQGKWQVLTSDAHAWPQLYIKGYGWMTFEPTPPGTAAGQGTDFKPSWSLPPSSSSGIPAVLPGIGGGKTFTTPGTIRNNAKPIGGPLGDHAGVSPDAGSGGGPPGGTLPVHHPPVPLIVLGALVVLALLTPRTVRTLTRRRRWLAARGDAGSAHAAWAETLDYLEDYGVRHGPGETPRAIAKRVTGQQRLTGPAAAALARLAQAEERASYAREPGPSGTLAADVMAVRKAVCAAVTRNARWQARLLPASAVNNTRRTLVHALDVFGWAELILTRLAKRIVRLRVRPGEG